MTTKTMSTEERRMQALRQAVTDPFVGFPSLDAAMEECKLTSQAEALARLLNRENLFITGLAGAGKTTVVNRFIDLIDAEYEGGVRVAKTASTGIAATLIGGKTIHSWAGLGVSTEPFDKKKAKEVHYSVQAAIKNTHVLIIDEISMMPAYLFTKLDETMRHFRRRSREPFGGVQLVLIGDFLQLPPVSTRQDREAGVDTRYAIETESWHEAGIGICFLDKTHRAADERLKKVLIDIAGGKVDESTRSLVAARQGVKPDKDRSYTTLFTKNIRVDDYNQARFAENPSPVVTKRALETLGPKGKPEHIEKIYKEQGPAKIVELKKNATMIVTKNCMSLEGSYLANGSIGRVLDIRSDKSVVMKMNDGSVATVAPQPYCEVKRRERPDKKTGKRVVTEEVVATVTQLPLKLGYAITTHRSQGQTCDGVVADLSECFQPGLGYVALSRVRSMDDLIITGLSPKAFVVSEKARRINVYVKKKAFASRKVLRESQEDYEALLTNSMYRLLIWGPLASD